MGALSFCLTMMQENAGFLKFALNKTAHNSIYMGGHNEMFA
jgi:hypothetical protein